MKTAILGLHAETSIHAGAGSSLDVIDLPIQREAHTNWPCVFGSAVKGALRACAKARGAEDAELVFGPERADASDYAGALLVGDARLALLPVRSLTGHFRWVTCPAILNRIKRDAERLDIRGFDFATPVVPPSAENDDPIALAPQGDSSRLFLEEFRYTVRAKPEDRLDDVVKALAELSGVDGFEAALREQLLVVGNEDFAFLCRHATPVTPHVALDSEKKTTKTGALWYEETLPPETLLYVCLAAHDTRKKSEAKDGKEEKLTAEAVLQRVDGVFADKPYLQLGGNETVGMGWCKTKWIGG